MYEFVIVLLAVGLGGFLQGLAGFGLVLIVVPLLSIVIDVQLAVPIAVALSWIVSIPLVFQMWSKIQWQTVIMLVLGSLPGAFIGTDMLKYLPASYILISLGILLIISSLYSFSHFRKQIKNPTKKQFLVVGFISGVLGASVGASGPPVITYMSMMLWSSDKIKATLLGFFFVQMFSMLLNFWINHLITAEMGYLVIKTLPMLIIGMLVGIWSYQRLNRHNINYKTGIHIFLFCMGVFLIADNVKALQ